MKTVSQKRGQIFLVVLSLITFNPMRN